MIVITTCANALSAVTLADEPQVVTGRQQTTMVNPLFKLLCQEHRFQTGEFDPGSERTLAAWIRHASRTRPFELRLRPKR